MIPADKKMTEAFNKREEDAFDAIYRLYYRKLVNYGYNILSEEDTARSIVQNVFMKLWNGRNDLTITSSVARYLFRSVYNSCTDHIKTRNIVFTGLGKETEEFYLKKIIQGPDAERILQDKELNAEIEKAISTLPPECARIFRMSWILGYKNKEIASQLSISEKTVENQITTALKKLRVQLRWLILMAFTFF